MRFQVKFSQPADEFKIDIPALFSFYLKLFYTKKYMGLALKSDIPSP